MVMSSTPYVGNRGFSSGALNATGVLTKLTVCCVAEVLNRGWVKHARYRRPPDTDIEAGQPVAGFLGTATGVTNPYSEECSFEHSASHSISLQGGPTDLHLSRPRAALRLKFEPLRDVVRASTKRYRLYVVADISPVRSIFVCSRRHVDARDRGVCNNVDGKARSRRNSTVPDCFMCVYK